MGVMVRQINLQVPAVKIKEIRGEVEIDRTEVIPGKVIIQGMVRKQIFTVGNDGLVHHQEEEVPFNALAEIPGAEPGMEVEVEPRIETILATLSPDGTSIEEKAVVELLVKVLQEEQAALSQSPVGTPILAEVVVGENTTQFIVENVVTLAQPAIKVDEVRVEIRGLEAEVIENKVVVQGLLHKQIFYVDTANQERHQAEDVPFVQTVDVPGALPGMLVQLSPAVEAVIPSLESPTLLRQKVVVSLLVKVARQETLRLVAGQGGNLYKVQVVTGTGVGQFMEEATVTLPVEAIKVREVVVSLRDVTTEVIAGKVLIQGTLHKQIFFIGADNLEHHLAEDLPFGHFIEVPGAGPGMEAVAGITVEDVLFDLIAPTQIRQKVIVAVSVVVVETQQLTILAGVGPLLKMRRVIGEDTVQVLVTSPPVPPTPVFPIVVTRELLFLPGGALTGQRQTVVESTFTLPDPGATQVLGITGEAVGVTTQTVENGVVGGGILRKQIRFVGPDGVVRTVTEEVPFSVLVSVPGAVAGQPASAVVTIEDINFQLSADGFRVDQQAVIRMDASVQTTEPRQVFVVTDVQGEGVVQNKVTIQELVVAGENLARTVEAASLSLSPPASAITNITATVSIVNTTVRTDEVQVRGNILKTVTYTGTDANPHIVEETVPFEVVVGVPGARPGMQAVVLARVVNLTFNLSPEGGTLNQEVEVELLVKAVEERTLGVVTSVSGPGIAGVVTEVLLLNVVGTGRIPVQVVTEVIPV